jgi:hypothetical protein
MNSIVVDSSEDDNNNDTFDIDMASVLAGVQQISMRRIFDELPCDETNAVRVRVSFYLLY